MGASIYGGYWLLNGWQGRVDVGLELSILANETSDLVKNKTRSNDNQK